MPRKYVWFLVFLPTLLGFDFWTKRTVEQTLPVGGEIGVVPGWVSILHAQNPDILFSIPMPLAAIAVGGVVALTVIGLMLWQLPAGSRLQAAALGTIAAGALGNLVDRIGDGSVTDFVRLYTDHPVVSRWLVEAKW